MIRNYFKIAWRNLLRYKAFSFINIVGLSLALASCMLIFLYAKDEISFDRFHKNAPRLYQLTCTETDKNGKKETYGIAAMIQGPSFKREIPEIEASVRVQENNFIVKKGTETFYENATWVDENFFSVFSFPLVSGDPKTVLTNVRSAVLTTDAAKKYFGKENPVGKTIELEIQNKFEPFLVTAIAKNPPQNSSIKFNILLSFHYQEANNYDDHWINLSYPTYLLLNPTANVQAVQAKMAKVFATQAGKQMEEERKHGYDATMVYGIAPFLSMHLNPKVEYTPESSNPIYVYILSGIALLILLIACINFINLTVAHSLRRHKEIGIRKVVGGQRKQLMLQFLSESFFICLFAFALAMILAKAALPFFNELANKQLALNYLFDEKLVAGFVVLFFLTVLAAGFYPALILSGFNPIKSLYNRSAFSGKNYFSKSLIVVQFSLATFMIIVTFFIYQQLRYVTAKYLGYNDKNLVVLHIGRDRDQKLMQVFRNEFSKVPGIQQMGLRQNGFWGTAAKANNRDISVAFEHIDENYLPALQIPLVGGRNFSAAFPGDSTVSVLVNEAFVKEAGWNNGVGKTVDFFNGQPSQLRIVGVVRDYHFGSLKQTIKPQLFTMQPGMDYGQFSLRLDPNNIPVTLHAIEKIYRSLLPYRPFKYEFMEDLNRQHYEAEAKWKQIITFSAAFTIFISCIGLFGLTMQAIQQRRKEIGIRKVLGASAFQISNLVSKNFIALVFLASLISIPVAWYAVDKWLQNFAYKIEMGWQVFALASLITLLVALTTVSFQAIKAAIANPVKNLRNE